jgi:hypothetical protein
LSQGYRGRLPNAVGRAGDEADFVFH